MEYKNVTKEMLLERIKELEALNKELLLEKEQEETLGFAWAGNLGHWYWNVVSNSGEFNPLKITTLGYKKNEIPEKVSYQFFTDLLHPDDYQKTMDAMLDHLYGKAPVYEAEYRIRTRSGSYKWYYDRGKITQRSEDGKPLFLAGIVFDITERKEMQSELERKNKILSELSAIDGLTNISNRRTLMEFLITETAVSEKTGRPLAAVIFDIDDFKKINDLKGHITGDKVLTETACIISACIRESDIAGRYGGEEFMVIFPGTDVDSAYNASERIRSEVEKHLFEGGIRITISGGVRQYSGEAPEELIRVADSKLYEAKRKGKNIIVR